MLAVDGSSACAKSSESIVPASPALGGAFAGRQVAAVLAAGQRLRQFGIKAPRDHADPVGARFLRLVAGGEDLRLEQILHARRRS